MELKVVFQKMMNQLKTFLIREPGDANPREVAVSKELTKDNWTSLDIPLTEWTSQGITLGDLFQFKFEGVDQWAKADVFLDNIYFWKNNPSIWRKSSRQSSSHKKYIWSS